jgi:hypothetical protein
VATDAARAVLNAAILAVLLLCAGCGTTRAPAEQAWWAAIPNGNSDGGGNGGGGGGGM